MSSFSTQIQVHSDLHLETPLAQPTYRRFSHATNFPLLASNLCLLGDIGCLRDDVEVQSSRSDRLFGFLRSLLARTPNLKIFYVLGNHEPYGVSMNTAIAAMEGFEQVSRQDFGNRFFFMNRRRVDLSPVIAILGCVLWSHITDEQSASCARFLTDFDEYAGIKERTVEQHNADHAADLAWLNSQVAQIEREEPHREIMVVTHHSPTLDSRANDPRHTDSAVRSGFVTDLAAELCWHSERVKVWAFGHTHFNFEPFEVDGKLIITNQKGYCYAEGKGNWQVRALVVEKGAQDWKALGDASGGAEETHHIDDSVNQKRLAERPQVTPETEGTQQRSFLGKAAASLKKLRSKG